MPKLAPIPPMEQRQTPYGLYCVYCRETGEPMRDPKTGDCIALPREMAAEVQTAIDEAAANGESPPPLPPLP